MPSFSLKWMLAAVAIVALGCVALLYASPWVVAATRGLAILLLLASPLGAVYRDGAKRAFWLGFAVFGIGYVALFGERPTDVNEWNHAPALVPLSYLYGVINKGGDEVGFRVGGLVVDSLDFYYVGNSLFVILLALLGGMIAQWFYVTNQAPHEPRRTAE